MTGLPPGVDLVDLIEDAVFNLGCIGYLELDEDELPPFYLVTEMAALAGECGDCASSPDKLAFHYLDRQREKWERSLPTWTCDCGRVYKALHGNTFYEARDDGLFGDFAGGIRTNSKGQVMHSDACRGCKRRFADVIADQLNPQGALF